ncbi:4'-phosphopantetheinyl transferase superfamily protein [compost metagenome]
MHTGKHPCGFRQNRGNRAMLYTTFTKQYTLFLTRFVRKMKFELEGPESMYRLNICVVSLPPEDGPLDYLSTVEREQYFSFKYPKRRNSYLLSKLSCKMAVASDDDDLTAIVIHHGVMRQPIVEGSERRITITHCDTMGAAIDYDPRLLIGVDIELVDIKAMDALARITSTEEHMLVHELGLQPSTFLTLLWTAKEAMSKVIQTGFTVPTELFEVKECVWKERCIISQFKNFPPFKAISILREKYVFTLVLPAKAMTEMGEIRLLQSLDTFLPL